MATAKMASSIHSNNLRRENKKNNLKEMRLQSANVTTMKSMVRNQKMIYHTNEKIKKDGEGKKTK